MRAWRFETWALVGGLVALLLACLGGLGNPRGFFAAYLFSALFVLAIALGATVLLPLHFLVGGRWGLLLRPLLVACARTLPGVAVMFVPLAFSLPWLFPWSTSPLSDPVLVHQAPYLNSGFFLGRAVLDFALWIALGGWVVREVERPTRARHGVGAVALIVYQLTASQAGIDWVMSLEPHWTSSIFGFLFCQSQVLCGFAFLLAAFCVLSAREPFAQVQGLPDRLDDLGNLLLTFVMIWAYLAFSQLLVIWTGNLPNEVSWYVHRSRGAWRLGAVMLVSFQVAFPFVLLLFRSTKRDPRPLGAVAGMVLAAGLFGSVWNVLPALQARGLEFGWIDLVMPWGLFGVWLASFAFHLRRRWPEALPKGLEVAHG